VVEQPEQQPVTSSSTSDSAPATPIAELADLVLDQLRDMSWRTPPSMAGVTK